MQSVPYAAAGKLLVRAEKFLRSSLIFDCSNNQQIYDTSLQSLQPEGFKCVMVGKLKATLLRSRQDHFVILIIPRLGENRVYERVGVGIVDGRDMEAEGPGERVQNRINTSF